MSRTKNRSDRRHNQLIIKHRDGSETAVTPMKPWTPPGQKGPIEPESRPDIVQAFQEMLDAYPKPENP